MTSKNTIHSLKRNLRKIAERQYGYFTASQALSAGYASRRYKHHLIKKNWLKISSGLYRLAGSPDSIEANFTKWSLWSRNQHDQPQGVISRHSALAYFGLGEYDPENIHLTVPIRFRKAAPEGVVIHKETLSLSDLTPREGFMLTRPAKTLQDLKAELSEQNLWELIIEKARQTDLLSHEECRRLGFAENIISLADLTDASPALSSPFSGGASIPAAPITISEPQTSQAQDSAGQSIYSLNAELIRERIYSMIFQRTQTSQSSRRRSQAGFTLVELLVVMAIISVLAGMLLPALQNAMDYARNLACLNNQKQQGLAIGMYANDWADWLLVKQYRNVGDSATNWKNQMAPYLGFHEPPFKAWFNGIDKGVFKCPVWNFDLGTGWGYGGGYAWNQNLGYSDDTSTRKNLARLKNLSETILIGDCISPDPSLAAWHYATVQKPSQGISEAIGDRHNSGANVGWADLHAKWDKWSFLVAGKSVTGFTTIDYFFMPKGL